MEAWALRACGPVGLSQIYTETGIELGGSCSEGRLPVLVLVRIKLSSGPIHHILSASKVLDPPRSQTTQQFFQ